MSNKTTSLTKLFWIVALICSPLTANAADQVLAIVGQEEIRSHDLEMALASSPFSTQFNTMNEDEQASMRGNMLRRLVSARLLALEAKRLGLDKTSVFKQDMEEFRLGLLYRDYMDKLRSRITIPPNTMADMKEHFKGDGDGLVAAKSVYMSTQFQAVKRDALQKILQDSNTRIYEARIKPGIKAETVLMEGNGFHIVYGDIVDAAMRKNKVNPEWVKQRLRERGEMILVSTADERDGADVSAQLNRYLEERLPALLLEKKTREWIPDDKALRDWYANHPETGRIPASYHVGQIVVATKAEAEALRERILKGESLFNLAGSNSIDPIGRKLNGDIGWITEGRGMPELLKVLATLPDNQVSEVIPIQSDYQLITVLERRVAKQKPFEDVRDRVEQMMVSESLPVYLNELEKRYPVSWNVVAEQAASQPVATP
jgi:hypothetical protein